MADIEWNDDEHRLTGATLHDGTEVVMVCLDDTDQDYIVTEEHG